MLKIAFALQIAVAAAVGLAGTNTAPAATEQKSVSRASCSVCDEVYDECILEGGSPAGCTRILVNCRKNCLP